MKTEKIYKEKSKHWLLRSCILFVAIGLLVWFTLYVICEQGNLTVTKYSLSTDKFSGEFKVTVLADLHNKEFGTDNKELVKLVKEQNSDVIACLGDFVQKQDPRTDIAYSLYTQLNEIAPVYAVLGNHETYTDNSKDYIQSIKDSGVALLDNEMIDIPVGNDSITLGGLTEYPFYEFDAPDYNNNERYFFDKFIASTNYKLLLTHKPELFMWGLKEYDIDLMLCGHTHGGCVNLPFVGSIYAPNQGFFPKYVKGLYHSDTATMIISGGLGATYSIPRINNPPEILVVTINGEK